MRNYLVKRSHNDCYNYLQSRLILMHDHAEMPIENVKMVIEHVYIDFRSQSELMIENSSTNITRNCYFDYGLRTKVPMIINDSAENNEKRLSLSCFRISFAVLKS